MKFIISILSTSKHIFKVTNLNKQNEKNNWNFISYLID